MNMTYFGKGEQKVGHIKAKNSGYGYSRGNMPITIKVELEEEEKGLTFSASGAIWQPEHLRNTVDDYDCVSCGQNLDSIEELANKNKIIYAEGWNKAKLLKIIQIWHKWHLNDLHAECEHQEEMFNKLVRIDGKKGEIKPEFIGEYGSLSLEKVWAVPEFAKCPTCGYKYGTAWTFRKLPEEVVKEVRDNYLSS